MSRKPAIGIGIAAAIAALGLVALASDSVRTEKPAAVDAQVYADFMAHEALDVQDLAEGAEIQRRTFNRMTPPGLAWVQPMFPMAVPFDAVNFDDKFLDELLGEDRNSVAVYPLTLALDPKTRETWIYNADGKLIGSAPSDGSSRAWPEDADPSRVTLKLDLLPAEDVEQYLYTEGRIAETLAAYSAKATKSSRTGGIVLKSLTPGQFGIANIQHLTNGNFRLTVTNGGAVAEVYSYTVWHTSSVTIGPWENDEGVTNIGTDTLWTAVSPSFNGLESEWDLGTTNLALTNGVGVWEDSNVSSNARVRFYGVAEGGDYDGDGLANGAELFVYHTDPGIDDTDGDGMGDGDEVYQGFPPTYSNEAARVWIYFPENGRAIP